MTGKTLGRRGFLRGVGALGIAGLAAPTVACGEGDNALTFFFQANSEEVKERREHPALG
ncbi:hypothetical protein [Nocardia sp. NPDC004722]